jgi:hypothetical protein
MSKLPLYDIAVRLNAVPATGPSVPVHRIRAPDTYVGTGAPRTLLVAKSMRAVCERATPVTSDVGSRLANPATLPMAPPARAPRRPAARVVRMAANRSSTVIGPAGTCTRVGANAFVSAPPVSLVLTTKLMFSASSGVSLDSW